MIEGQLAKRTGMKIPINWIASKTPSDPEYYDNLIKYERSGYKMHMASDKSIVGSAIAHFEILNHIYQNT